MFYWPKYVRMNELKMSDCGDFPQGFPFADKTLALVIV